MQSFGGPFHRKINWAGTFVTEDHNRKNCILVTYSLKLNIFKKRRKTGYQFQTLSQKYIYMELLFIKALSWFCFVFKHQEKP